MIKSFNGISPIVPASSFVSATALVMGDVELGEFAGVWPGAIIRGDFAKIKVG
jgi:carbonic anhydrase/acetyltransferase-like protein (isoleucine patch superfamily)